MKPNKARDFLMKNPNATVNELAAVIGNNPFVLKIGKKRFIKIHVK